MVNKKQNRAIEIMAVLLTVFGVWSANTLSLYLFEGKEYSGNDLLQAELLIFGIWYVFVGILTTQAHPRPNKVIMLLISTLISFLLLTTSGGWTDSNLGWFSRFITWFVIFSHYLIVIPIFVILGHISEKKSHA